MYSRVAVFARICGDLLLALLFLLLFLYLRINVDELVAVGRVRGFVAPTFWPTWILNAALACSALLTVRLIFKAWRDVLQAREDGETGHAGVTGEAAGMTRDERPESSSQEASKTPSEAREGQAAHLLWWLGIPLLLFGFIYALPYLGFVPSTLLFGVLYALYLGERNPLIVLGLPTVMVALILLVFTRLLSVPLPPGVGVFHAFSLLFY